MISPVATNKESACCSWRRGFNPWMGKVPWRRAWQPTPVRPGEHRGQKGLVGHRSDMKLLSM